MYENWTDVSGCLMADPRIVRNPETIRYVTYRELREGFPMGASVLHETRSSGAHCGHSDQYPQHEPSEERARSSATRRRITKSEYPITGIAGHKDFAIINVERR